MELATPIVEKTGMNSYSVKHGDDKGMYVEFDTMSEYQEFESLEKGRAIHKDIEIIKIYTPGKMQPQIRKVMATSTPSQPSDIDRWPRQYEAFKNKTKISPDGTAITEWPVISSKSEALNLKSLNIHTVEQLAAMPDTLLEEIGLGARQLREKAQAYVAKGDSTLVLKVQEENRNLKNDLEMMKNQIKELSQQKEIKDVKKANIVGAHLPPLAAGVIVGTSAWAENSGAGLTATGSSITDALQLTADVNHVSTVGASTGVKLDPNASMSDRCMVYNASGTTLNIYPPDANGTINTGTAGAAITLATHKCAEFVKTSNINWAYVVTG